MGLLFSRAHIISDGAEREPIDDQSNLQSLLLQQGRTRYTYGADGVDKNLTTSTSMHAMSLQPVRDQSHY
jgi:hypothetical protein